MPKNKYEEKSDQTEPSTASVGVECQILKPHISLPEPDESDESESDGDVQEDMDMYDPEEDEELFESDDFNFTSGSYVEEDKFSVFKSSLWELFATCPRCTEPCLVEKKARIGTKVVIRQKCLDAKCGFHRDWSSQPSYTHNQGRIPAGNLQLSGAILFTGASPTKVLRVLKSMNIASISPSTFNNHQSKFLVPTVMHTWQNEQEKYFKKLREMDGGLVLGCDGRADSPGHSAKYGSYIVLEERINKIIDHQLVQSNEVANSGQMEKEGLIRAVSKLQDAELPIDVIVTDRHPQIQKWLRISLKDTTHYFDVWHVSKGLTKKLEMLAKKPGCEPLRTAACKLLTTLLDNTRLKNDVKKLSPLHQTSNVEAYHSVILQFCPKNTAYSFLGMLCRLEFLDATDQIDTVDAQFSMDIPETSQFKDLHGGMVDSFPALTLDRIVDYLSQFDKKLEDKSKAMYKESCTTGKGQKDVCVSSCLGRDEKNSIIYKVLQTFHKVKVYKGSPMKSDDFEAIRGKKGRSLLFDPRPQHMRNSVNNTNRFRNTCLNYMHQEKNPMPVMHLFPPANPYAVACGHDYLDKFLKDNMISVITDEQIANLEAATRGQAGNKQWQQVRQYRITSSSFGALCKATEWRDLAKLAHTMTSYKEIKKPPTANEIYLKQFADIQYLDMLKAEAIHKCQTRYLKKI
ncbi:hypothetical protein GQR58_001851 [Nymphon striatum]|nr:hypothetical protein GQR58_001851 [Nymphon striatum]